MKSVNSLDFESEDMQRMVERFFLAKWITGTNIVTPEQFYFTFTALGTSKMSALAETLTCITPTVFNLPGVELSRIQSLRLTLKFVIQLAMLSGELRKPSWRWMPGERGAMIGLICGYAMKHGAVLRKL